MPTATDLVTDLPADFEVFGQAVATSMADLLGGTSGQILSKNSNTDMDFVWIANDQGDITGITATSPLTGGGTSGAVTVGIQDALTTQKGAVQLSDSTSTTSSILASTPTATKAAYDLANAAIAKSTVTTAGDIIYRNATVPTRLAIGTAGQVLKVNSGATAPEWANASAASGMTLIARTTFSNVASQAFDGVFTSTYRNYLVVIDQLYAATSTDKLLLQLRYAGPTTQAGGYYGGNIYGRTNSATVTNDYYAASASIVVSQATGSSSVKSAGYFYISNVGNTSETAQWNGQFSEGQNGWFGTFSGCGTTARTYTGFQIYTSASNITGTVSIYGLAIA
jgi:hypothetical protein